MMIGRCANNDVISGGVVFAHVDGGCGGPVLSLVVAAWHFVVLVAVVRRVLLNQVFHRRHVAAFLGVIQLNFLGLVV